VAGSSAEPSAKPPPPEKKRARALPPAPVVPVEPVEPVPLEVIVTEGSTIV